MDVPRLIETLKLQEGFVPHAYQDSKGYWTIGYGTLIDERLSGELTEEESEYLLRHRVQRAIEHAETLDFWDTLSPVRQEIISNMVFNMGLNRFRGFKKAIAALQIRDYDKAAAEMLDSKWAKQVGQRAVTLADAMRTGMWLGHFQRT